MKKVTKPFLLLFCMIYLLLFNNIVQAKEILPKPTSNIYVQDYANMLSKDAKDNLLKQSEIIAQNSGPQICVVTIDTLNGEPINDYANKLFRTWGIGQKDKDNGILLLIVKNDHKDRIEVGRGIEDILPDIKCMQILDSIKEPLKNEDYNNAITMAFNGISSTIQSQNTNTSTLPISTNSPNIIVIIGIIGAILLSLIIIIITLKVQKKKEKNEQQKLMQQKSSNSSDINVPLTTNSNQNSNVGFHKEYNIGNDNLNKPTPKGPTIIIKNKKTTLSSSNNRKHSNNDISSTRKKTSSNTSSYSSGYASEYTSSYDDSSKNYYSSSSYDSSSSSSSSDFGGGSSDGGGCSSDW